MVCHKGPPLAGAWFRPCARLLFGSSGSQVSSFKLDCWSTQRRGHGLEALWFLVVYVFVTVLLLQIGEWCLMHLPLIYKEQHGRSGYRCQVEAPRLMFCQI